MQVSTPVTHLIQQARHGVLRRRVDEIARLIGLSDKEMAHILNMSVRSLHGKMDSERLSLAASERLLLLERLINHALHTFDGRAELVNRWLHTPLAELSYSEERVSEASPLQAMGSFQQPSTTYTPTEKTSDDVPQSPLAILDTVSGFSLAEDVLGRIEWGILG
ncbi:antitoxin Xre-like helix-turn-helix domain-containing protein [Siphonobacter sp. SORGH_AS_1065]|uniref:antitoxin Xre-like helix-turn-helix domain-containing protein n=1 Tax=Siphonobacter sp. SORGH_AS_1065 TaxID=3041795 RepID=UPI0027897FE8|nr:antitoxin Xre-like helix-turn-helix domain-containing protein [Siphonobacter sp. SORGH_AS_1065]MDQ1090092.1 uncharacterized protein (DUF2384 family) [Siphonobacter sp. SORGH_AS_1065]